MEPILHKRSQGNEKAARCKERDKPAWQEDPVQPINKQTNKQTINKENKKVINCQQTWQHLSSNKSLPGSSVLHQRQRKKCDTAVAGDSVQGRWRQIQMIAKGHFAQLEECEDGFCPSLSQDTWDAVILESLGQLMREFL